MTSPVQVREPVRMIKRDGSVMPFDRYKIREAMRRANRTVPAETLTDNELDILTANVVRRLDGVEMPGVEHIQDQVEEVLMEAGLSQTAKSYILYRAKRTEVRKAEDDLMNLYKKITFSDAFDSDLKRENANIDGDTSMGTMLKYGSEGSKYFIDKHILPEDMAKAHAEGRIHIHDKDFYVLTETCCQIDLIKLFDGGFSTGHGYLREPQSIQSYAALACIAIQANQNEMHGGQAVPHFDYAMAEGVNKTYRKSLLDYLAQALELNGIDEADTRAEELVRAFEKAFPREKGSAGQAVSGLAIEQGDDFKNFAAEYTFGDDVVPLSAEQIAAVHERACRKTDKETYQAMQALVHNLNTMNSRAGAQVPFSSLNYGTDTSEAGRMVMRNLMNATMDGLGNGETPIFPVQIFKVKKGVNYDEGDPNYDLFKQAIRTSAKRLFPNFSFLDAPFNKQYLKVGDYQTEVAYMGCRTRVMGNTYDKNREITCGRGNLSFTSINLPRIGIEARGDLEDFYKNLDETIDLVFRQLLHRFNIQTRKTVRNYPFLMGQGVWIDSDRLGPDDSVEEVLRHGTLTVGFIGLAETLVALTGKHHGESAAAQKLGLEIIGHMRDKCDRKAAETGLNFSLIATPAEGLSGRFVAMDKKRYGILPGITEHDFYTNSFHIPVYYPISAFDKIRIEAPYHALTNAGHISYVELDGDTAHNPEAFEKVVRCMAESGIGYGSVNHPVDRDPICGYTGIIGDTCPRCGRHEGEAISLQYLAELRKKYPDVPDTFFGKA